MSEYRLSNQAEIDLDDILDYTAEMWGDEQAEIYLADLLNCFTRIANMPGLGRTCDPIQPGLRRIDQGKHVVYYKPEKEGVFISRILHQRMLPGKHILEGL